MHAYLVIGRDWHAANKEIEKLIAHHKAQSEEASLEKIADVKALGRKTQLKYNAPYAFVLRNVDKASPESMNAFLKNLEEAQDNLFYILTADSEKAVLPTILSRCQAIRVKSAYKTESTKETIDFLNLSQGEMLNAITKYKDRAEAVSFIESVLVALHTQLIDTNDAQELQKLSQKLKLAELTRKRLEANANVLLQLTNFVVQSI